MKGMMGCAAAIAIAAAGGSAQAQTTVYKCSLRSYSETPCSSRVVRTYESPVDPPRRAPEVVAHRLPGESDEALAVRRHRIGLGESDRSECARLDKKIPFEAQRARASTDPDEVDEAQQSLADARKRFKALRC